MAKLQGCLKKFFFFKISPNMIERCRNKKKMKTRKIEISKYIHLISYNYLKNIVKNLNLKNKNVKKWIRKLKFVARTDFTLLIFL